MFIFFKSTVRSSNFTCNLYRNWNSIRQVTETIVRCYAIYRDISIIPHILEFRSRAIMNYWYGVLLSHDMKCCTINLIYHWRWYLCVTDIHDCQVSYKKSGIFSNPAYSKPSAWIINVPGFHVFIEDLNSSLYAFTASTLAHLTKFPLLLILH